MLDALELPILLKAIDFVFDEGRKILEERRARRKANAALAPSEEKQPEAEPTLPAPEPKEEVKQDLISTKIDEILWKNHEEEIQHLVRLLETYSRNYHITKEQYAKWGSAMVPPIIVHNVTEAENSMMETIKQLEIVLSKVYQKDLSLNQ